MVAPACTARVRHLRLQQQPILRPIQQRLPARNRQQRRGVGARGWRGRERGRQAAQGGAQRAQRGGQHAVHAGPCGLDVARQACGVWQAVQPGRYALQVQPKICMPSRRGSRCELHTRGVHHPVETGMLPQPGKSDRAAGGACVARRQPTARCAPGNSALYCAASVPTCGVDIRAEHALQRAQQHPHAVGRRHRRPSLVDDVA